MDNSSESGQSSLVKGISNDTHLGVKQASNLCPHVIPGDGTGRDLPCFHILVILHTTTGCVARTSGAFEVARKLITARCSETQETTMRWATYLAQSPLSGLPSETDATRLFQSSGNPGDYREIDPRVPSWSLPWCQHPSSLSVLATTFHTGPPLYIVRVEYSVVDVVGRTR